MPIKVVKNRKPSTMKAILTILAFSIAMTACVYNEEPSNVNFLNEAKQEHTLTCSMDTAIYGSRTSHNQSIPDEAFAQVSICIQNHMPDLYLEVESIRLCNIHLSATYHFATEAHDYYWETDTLSTLTICTGQIKLAPNEETSFPEAGSITFIPQTTRTWIPVTLPQQSEESYFLLNCKVFNSATIWSDGHGHCAEVAIPLSVNFKSNQHSVIVLTMAPNCPWYNIKESTPQPIFMPIAFNATVEDWID